MPASSMVDSVVSVFLVLQLMKIRHTKSEPFFQEICFSSYPTLPFDDCLTLVSKSLNKYDGSTDDLYGHNNFSTVEEFSFLVCKINQESLTCNFSVGHTK